jgi:hypothetical protein
MSLVALLLENIADAGEINKVVDFGDEIPSPILILLMILNRFL